MISYTGMRNSGDPTPGARVLLDCEGDPSCGAWVRHRFVDMQLVARQDGKPGMETEVVYQCTQCGHHKRFGVR